MAKYTVKEPDFDVDFPADLRSIFWRFFNTNRSEEIIEVGWWFVRFTITLGDLEPVFTRIFGPNPRF